MDTPTKEVWKWTLSMKVDTHTHRGRMEVNTLTQEVWRWAGSVKVDTHTEDVWR